MTIASQRTHSNAVKAALVAAFTATPVVVCDAVVPKDGVGWPGTPGQSIFVPYVVLYPLGSRFDGPLGANAYDDADFTYQITCVGESREQAEGITDVVNTTFIGQTLTVSGRTVTHIVADNAAAHVRRDDSVQPPVFMSTPRYAIYSTPT